MSYPFPHVIGFLHGGSTPSMSPSKKPKAGKTRTASKPSKMNVSPAVRRPKMDAFERKILQDYWSHLPAPPDEEEWMSGRI